jgi:hypothetical protein
MVLLLQEQLVEQVETAVVVAVLLVTLAHLAQVAAEKFDFTTKE